MVNKRSIYEIINSLSIPKLRETPHGFKGCCVINPDHIDTSPSMHIHLEKGHVKCFACDAYKPLFSFLIDAGVPFDEAIEFMFTDYKKEREETVGLDEYFLGTKLPKSMIDRGFSPKTLKHFEVGFDEFEGHTTIPLRYPNKGILYGIQFRQYPKKLWATDNFNKDNFIYNFEPTEERIYVEGFTDTWRAWQNGTENVSATLSANPSEGQLAIMSQHKRILLAYDMDVAGLRGAFTVHREIGRQVDIRMVPYRATDPGECTKENWLHGINNHTSFTEFEVSLINKKPELYEQIIKKKWH